jgi:hypothetical protein
LFYSISPLCVVLLEALPLLAECFILGCYS